MNAEERKAIDALLDGLTEKPEPAEPVTTVTVWWDRNIEHPIPDEILEFHSHLFTVVKYEKQGTPDIPRIIKETLEQGALAIKVECTEKFDIINIGLGIANKMYLWSSSLGEIIQNNDYCTLSGYYGWSWSEEQNYITYSDIESAIKSWLGKQKEPDYNPEYYKGSGYVFNEKQPKRDATIRRDCTGPLPEFCVGQIVVVDGAIGIITSKESGYCYITYKSGRTGTAPYYMIRPATPAEIASFYTCELAGEKVRAYEDEDGSDVYFIHHNEVWDDVRLPFARHLCKKAGIPIMPYSESKGNYDPPKGE